MKLSFDKPAMEWLHATVNKVIVVAHKQGEESMERTARKMRHKFNGNPPVVFLTEKERKLIGSLAAYRWAAIGPSPSEEYTTIKSILEVLGDES